jgi:hypothetical protein
MLKIVLNFQLLFQGCYQKSVLAQFHETRPSPINERKIIGNVNEQAIPC